MQVREAVYVVVLGLLLAALSAGIAGSLWFAFTFVAAQNFTGFIGALLAFAVLVVATAAYVAWLTPS